MLLIFQEKFYGDHNKQNILAAYVVGKILKFNDKYFINTLKNFKGLKHRNEVVYKNKKLLVINDSKATNLSAAIFSIKSYKSIYLIMGGKLKNRNYKELVINKNRINKIYLIGESTNYIYHKLSKSINCQKSIYMNSALKCCFKDCEIPEEWIL